ncbi:ATP-binding protein [Streptomyces sp. LBUM 1479]|nr:ATP-binding protein [Streptomyces sp. LBUM 1479]
MPKTEADLQAAVDGGLFEESHHLDLKKAPSSKGDNKELARDLSSFAVDGGALIIGVQENKESRTFELAPQPLSGLSEKVEQVARTIPDPPLTVITEEIGSATDDGTGYLVVHIPASPVAPHMVDTGTSAAATRRSTRWATPRSSACTHGGETPKPTPSPCCARRWRKILCVTSAPSPIFPGGPAHSRTTDMCLPITGAQTGTFACTR